MVQEYEIGRRLVTLHNLEEPSGLIFFAELWVGGTITDRMQCRSRDRRAQLVSSFLDDEMTMDERVVSRFWIRLWNEDGYSWLNSQFGWETDRDLATTFRGEIVGEIMEIMREYDRKAVMLNDPPICGRIEDIAVRAE